MTLAAVIVVVAALYFAADVLIPFSLALLLSFLLAPLVAWLERWRLGRVPSVLVAVILAFGTIGFVGWIVGTELVQLGNKLPQYRSNIEAKLRWVRSAPGGAIGRATQTLKELGQELSAETVEQDSQSQAAPGPPPAAPTPEPVPVRTIETTSPMDLLWRTIATVGHPLATAGIVIIFVIFMLVQREDLRDRVIRLAGRGQILVTTQALNDAGWRISRYLLMNLIVNVTYGVPIGVGLYFIGVPSPMLWGLMATVLRFIPYLGPWIAALMPIALSFAIEPGWYTPLYTIALFVVVELISNNVVEPLLYGSSTGLSSLAVLLAAVFWTWLWGAVGLLMSVPLTVCIMVLGRHVPQLEFLRVLLTDEPVLSPAVRIYQRLLADDLEDAATLAEEFMQEHSLAETYDGVLLPAMSMAEQDCHRGDLSRPRSDYLLRCFQEVAGRLAELKLLTHPGQEALEPVVLCLPARDKADEVAARMLQQLLREKKLGAEVLTMDALASEMVQAARQQKPALLCISAVPPSTFSHVRYLFKRLQQLGQLPPVLVGLWTYRNEPAQAQRRLNLEGEVTIAVTLGDAADRISSLVLPATSRRPHLA